MAINKIPKNYYSDTNIRRDKINEIIDDVNELDTHPVVPTPAAGDVGKVIKVDSDANYTLGSDEALPDVTSSDNGSILEVTNGEWNKVQFSPYKILATTAGRIVSVCTSTGVKIIKTSENTLSYLNGFSRGLQAIINEGDTLLPCPIFLDIESKKYGGVVVSNSTNMIAVVNSDNGVTYLATITTNDITLTEIGSITYIDVTASGGVVTLPQDVTYADITALVDAGVNVQLRQALSSSYRYFHLAGYDETNGLFFENSYFGASELTLYEIHLNETVSEIRYKTITFDT